MTNKIVLIGNLTANPEISTLKGTDKKIAKFSIAVNRRFGEGVDYFKCTAWGKLANLVEEYCSKGNKVCVIGSVELTNVEYDDGTYQLYVNVNCEEVEFLTPKAKEETEQEEPKTKPKKRVTNKGKGLDPLPF